MSYNENMHAAALPAIMHAAALPAIIVETPEERAARLAHHAASVLAAQNFIGYHTNDNNLHPDNFASDRSAAAELRRQQDARVRRRQEQRWITETLHTRLVEQLNAIAYERTEIEDAIRKVAEYEAATGRGKSRTGKKGYKRTKRTGGSRKHKR